MKIKIEDYINRIIISVILFSFCQIVNSQTKSIKVLPPDNGVYHTAFSRIVSFENNVTQEEVKKFTDMVNKKIVWMNISNHWFEGIKFPKESVKNIWAQGVVPCIRMLPWSDYSKNDEKYSLTKIYNGIFDDELIKYANDVKNSDIPIMIEFAAEPNGDWFPWAGVQNRFTSKIKEDSDSELYKKAYIHVFNIFKKQNVKNVTWVFHVNSVSSPEESWNKISSYYPGDDYVDWIGVSIYGAMRYGEKFVNFQFLLETCYDQLCALSTEKPLAILEFGVADYLPDVSKPLWIQSALYTVSLPQFNRIKAIGWWNSTWWNSDGTISALQIDSSPESLSFYKEGIAQPFFIGEVKLGE